MNFCASMKTMARELHVFAHKLCVYPTQFNANEHLMSQQTWCMPSECEKIRFSPLDSPSVDFQRSGRAEVFTSSEMCACACLLTFFYLIDKIQFQLPSRFDNMIQCMNKKRNLLIVTIGILYEIHIISARNWYSPSLAIGQNFCCCCCCRRCCCYYCRCRLINKNLYLYLHFIWAIISIVLCSCMIGKLFLSFSNHVVLSTFN